MRAAGLTISADKGIVSGINVTRNWIYGGEAGIQANYLYAGQTQTTLGTIGGNRFDLAQHDYGGGSRYQLRYKTGYVVLDETTNYFDPDAPSVPAGMRAQAFVVGTTGTSGIRRG